jgi:hypothetical protein
MTGYVRALTELRKADVGESQALLPHAPGPVVVARPEAVRPRSRRRGKSGPEPRPTAHAYVVSADAPADELRRK